MNACPSPFQGAEPERGMRVIVRQQVGLKPKSNYVDVHFMNVRRALVPCAPADFLETVNGVGYRAA
jgi:DNA-binding response OmpR family regulator